MKLTEKDKSILIGLLLGDGYIDDKGRICIEHGEKQKEYCIYKAKLLHSVCGGRDIKVKNNLKNLLLQHILLKSSLRVLFLLDSFFTIPIEKNIFQRKYYHI